jgi:hypothetical protein
MGHPSLWQGKQNRREKSSRLTLRLKTRASLLYLQQEAHWSASNLISLPGFRDLGVRQVEASRESGFGQTAERPSSS